MKRHSFVIIHDYLLLPKLLWLFVFGSKKFRNNSYSINFLARYSKPPIDCKSMSAFFKINYSAFFTFNSGHNFTPMKRVANFPIK